MILSTLLGPPDAPPETEAEAPDYPEHGVVPVTRQRARRYRRSVSIGVVISVLFHLALVFISPLVIRYIEDGRFMLPSLRTVQPPRAGMQVVEVEVSETADLEPVREPARPEPEPEEELGVPGVEAEPDAEPLPPAAERLRPRVGDWRLWIVPPATRSADLTPEQRNAELRARLYARLEAVDDSIAAALAAEAAAMDWTVGEEGNKWGVTPGQLHLGPVTLPLPFFIQPSREDAEAMRDWSAIQQQAGQAVIDESFEERVKAIRERKAKEQAEKDAKRDTTSGG